MSSSFGRAFRVQTFGESHGQAIGVVIDGVPAGVLIDPNEIAKDMARRKPGQSKITTQRKEEDQVEILSGIFEGTTLGSPIALLIRNKDAKSKDYNHLKGVYRPSHADFTYDEKYGYRDHRGGGRSSARETANWVAAGSIAKQLLKTSGVNINAGVTQVGSIKSAIDAEELNFESSEDNLVRCPIPELAVEMERFIQEVKKSGDTVGGSITCVVRNVPSGWGEPVFDKLQSRLAQAMMGINAAKGFDYGSGFDAARMKGSEHNDSFTKDKDGKIITNTNFSGGIQGGISNGSPIYFKVAFKPIATLLQIGESMNKAGEKVVLEGKGRHDPCVVPRAVPIVEAMTALVLADFYLLSKLSKI